MPNVIQIQSIIKQCNGIGPDFGINWDWAYFRTEADAEHFLNELARLGWESRGIYPPRVNDGRGHPWGVRYRQ